MEAVKPIEVSQLIDMGSYVVPYVSYGAPNDEPSLVLLHGISMPETHWAKLPEVLAKLGHHILAVGLPEYKYPLAIANMIHSSDQAASVTKDFMNGNVRSGINCLGRMMRRHAFLPTLGGYAEDQASAIHELTGYKPYNLLGLSYGGLLAQQHALDDAKNIVRLVLAGTFPAATVPFVDMPDAKAIAGIWSYKRSPEKSAAIYGGRIAEDVSLQEELSEILHRKINPIKHVNQLIAASISTGPLFARRMMQRILRDDATETLVMAGTEDKIVPYNTARLATLVLGQTLESIPDGHGFLLSNPIEMAGIVSKFLRMSEVNNES